MLHPQHLVQTAHALQRRGGSEVLTQYGLRRESARGSGKMPAAVERTARPPRPSNPSSGSPPRFTLSRLISADPADASLYRRRSRAYAHLGRWLDAGADLLLAWAVPPPTADRGMAGKEDGP